MMEIWLPYGKSKICTKIPTRNFLGKIEPNEIPGVVNSQAEIERAIREPIGTERLIEMVKPGSKVAIVVDDATRPTPSYLLVPPILNELTSAGIKDTDVTVIFGLGTHREVKPNEMKKLVGESVLKRVKAINHNPNSDDQVYFGMTSFGTKVYVNKVFAEADVKILTGDIGFHYYAGYGGGRKSVLPAVSSVEAIQKNHEKLVLHPKSRTGILEGNPVHEDMAEAAKLTKVDFILNIVANSNMEIVKAFAGDLEKAFYEGTKYVDKMYKVFVEQKSEIVLVSSGGYPSDIDFYQAYVGIHHALSVVKRGGVIVLVAKCPEGHGNQAFYEWMDKFKDVQKMENELKKRFLLGGHKAYFLKKALQKARIIIVSVMPNNMLNTFNLKSAKEVDEALRNAFDIAGKNARVWVIPHGNATLPVLKRQDNSYH